MTPQCLLIDFETRSHCNLPQAGAYNYATDPTTQVICCSFADPDDLSRLWTWRNPLLWPGLTNIWPDWLLDALEDKDTPVCAHNAQFDRLIWEYVAVPDYDFPMVGHLRWVCTSAIARVNALPSSLDRATRALTGERKKDFRGTALIKECSIPPFNEDPRLLEEMVEYCEQDVRATAILVSECRMLTPEELMDWHVNEAINDRGVRVNTQTAELAAGYAMVEADAIAARLTLLTNGTITKHTQTARIRDYVLGRCKSDSLAQYTTVEEIMTRWKDGKKRFSVDKAARAELMDRAAQLDIPEEVVEVLQLTDDGNRSSVFKFLRMSQMADPEDDRVRGAFVYAGASQTLRAASHGIQFHNMRRDCWSPAEAAAIAKKMRWDDPPETLVEGVGVMDVLSKLLRPTMIPAPGCKFVIGDWSSIEAMGLPWLSDSVGGQVILDLFRGGNDIYVYAAEQLGIDDRQIGKVATLSLGYGGGVGAFRAMARNYGVHLDEGRVQHIVQVWRAANNWAVQFWRDLHRAACAAVRTPRTPQHANNKVSYYFDPELLGGTLMCIFPGCGENNQTVIQYPKARLETNADGRTELTAMKAGWIPAADAKEWPRVTLWHGLLAENVTQGFCAAILRAALRELEETDGPGEVVLHVHDEIVLEVPEGQAYAAKERLGDTMRNAAEEFAIDLPLKAEPTIADAYGKG